MNAKRNIKYDNIKGLLIFFVVLAHLLYSLKYYNNNLSTFITRFIYTFHMPLFLIISGIFSKKVDKKSLLNILLLFIFLNISYTLYDYLTTSSLNLFSIKYSAWYLIALFIYRLIIYLDKNNIISTHKKTFLITLFIITNLISFLNIPYNRLITYSFFFFLGYSINFSAIKISKKLSIIGLIISILLLLNIASLPLALNFFMASPLLDFNFLFLRIFTYLIVIFLFIFIYNLISSKNIFFITKWGENSLSIYMFHRLLTIIITDKFINNPYFYLIILLSSFLICFIFSNNYFKKYLKNTKYITISIIILLILIFLNYLHLTNKSSIKPSYLSLEKYNNINNSISLGFVGDLILLENQVKNSYINNTYNFDYMFEQVADYFQDVDYMMGVLEGPVDDNKPYSIGNFDDGKTIKLNYPSAFLSSIKKSGIDLVTVPIIIFLIKIYLA